MQGVLAYGAHGDETLSIELGQSLVDDPVDGITPIELNPKAVAEQERYIEENSAMSFWNPDEDSPVYERREAARVIEEIDALDPDFIIDFHTTHSKNCDVAFINPQASRLMVKIAQFLKFKDIIIADFGNIGSRFPNTLNVEVSDDPANPLRSVKHWRYELQHLVDIDWSDYIPPADTRLWVRVGTLMVEDLMVPDYYLREDIGSMPYANAGIVELSHNHLQRFDITNKHGRIAHDTHAFAWSTAYLQYGGVSELIVPAGSEWSDYFFYSGKNRPSFPKPYTINTSERAEALSIGRAVGHK